MEILLDMKNLPLDGYRRQKLAQRFNTLEPITVLGSLMMTGENPTNPENQFDYYLACCHKNNSLASFDWALNRVYEGSHLWVPESAEYANLRDIERNELNVPCMWIRHIDARPAANKFAKLALARYDD